MSEPNYTSPSYVPGTLPPGAAEELRLDHPKLLELRNRYAAFKTFEHPLWTPDMLKHLGLFDKLTEDALFGIYAYDFNGRQTVTRNLLDSILQINFLERHINLTRMADLKVLDLGAGYGRLAWRMAKCLPNLHSIWCADAIAESTFLCGYYLNFREAGPKATVVPLDEVQAVLRNQRVDLVTNIQSFSECTLASIEWWLSVLSTARVHYLMIMPSTPDRLLSTETDGSRLDFQPLIEAVGYRLVVRESCYESAPSVRKFGVYGSGQYWLFRG